MKSTQKWNKASDRKTMLLTGMAAKATLVAVLAFGLVLAGCDNGAQEIEGAVGISTEAPAQVSAVTVTATTNNQYFIVSWTAPAEDLSYEVHFVQDGKLSNVWGGSDQNTYKYAAADGEQSANDDLDNWSVRISSSQLANLTQTPGAYKFGVRTSFNNSDINSKGSDIVWSTPVTLVAGPVVSTVTAALSGNTATLTWAGVPTGQYYNVSVERNDGTGWLSTSIYSSGNTDSISSTGTYKYRVKVTSVYSTPSYNPIYNIYAVPGVWVESNSVTHP
ncbi:hypothetical protein FACS189444_5160 [Spirochaetia bacterium]|nr:hypothetical protein FACS189444_5160 [Spirochaetia bacterium]